MFAYMRRYFGRMVIVLTLVTPLLMVMTYQWAPRRGQREADELVTIALASAQTRTAYAQDGVGVVYARQQPLPPTVSQLAGVDGVRPVAWYRVAAAEHRIDPYLLEALHQIESSAATDGCWPNLDGSGAVGPFQFKRPTFDEVGVDGNGDGIADICGFVDSLASAARYLRTLGADDQIDGPAVRQALERYGTDVERVLNLARYFRARDASLTASAPAPN
ncbi:MAG: lytic murein transglycosylase [Chloroflexi bacterium]|nr:lytic murein transglycosylase [Chloroflexota bacterium]